MVSAGTAKMLSPASRMAFSRSSRLTRRSGSTTLMRNGSAGKRMAGQSSGSAGERPRRRDARLVRRLVLAHAGLRRRCTADPAHRFVQVPRALDHVVFLEERELLLGGN